VPAVPWPVEKEQPDGTKISVYIRGDEKVHWMESLDGYSLMYNAEKYIVYAEQNAAGDMVPSQVRFEGKSAQPLNLKKGLMYSADQVKAMTQIWEITSDAEEEQRRTSGMQKAGATTGSRKALCVLMGFSDRTFGKSKAEFETLFNQLDYYPSDGSAKGSVRDFFKENSYGKLDFTVTIVGPYEAPNTRQYYATHEREFATYAANAANADVDYNEFADAGRLETFHILFAGFGDEAIGNGNQIWSHKWQLAAPITLDGVQVSVYSCSPELRGYSGNNTTYIGVVCHELSHVFGAPDYYDTGGTGYLGSGNWDLMAEGSWNDNGRQPGHINMFQKMLYGWVTPRALNSFAEITSMPPSAQEPVAYTIPANTNGEMYVLENRQQVGFDASVPGHGLLIWHVHPNALTGRGSNASHPQQLYPVVASSSYAIPTATVASYGNINSAGTPFPGTSGKTAFSAKTTPAMFTWTGPQTISKPITEIKEAADKTISFKILDGPTVPVTDLQATVANGNVKLTWTAANHAEVLGYKIYRDGVLLYTINNKATVTYSQIGVTNGAYQYGVTAFYEATESPAVTVAVTVSDGSDAYQLPITGLQGSATLNKAYLNWTAPFSGGWMSISGSASDAYSLGAFPFFVGTYWGPEELRGLDGYELTQYRFYYYERNVPHTIQIWEITETGIHKIHDQPYAGTTTQGAKTVTLTTPLVIDADKE
jgi:M6 family metalloprotease-like protein